MPTSPDKPMASIEKESYSEQITAFDEDDQGIEPSSAPIFIPEGVLVGIWYVDGSQKLGRPVYCLVEKDLEFAYLRGELFIVRLWDFDPLNRFGDCWRGDDTEDDNATSPGEMKMWARNLWKRRKNPLYRDITLGKLNHLEETGRIRFSKR
jgi:hypothetical protein